MSVRARVGIAAVLLAAFSVASFGAVAFILFVRQQDRQLEQVLRQDLERVTSLLAQPRLGAALPEPRAEGYVLQLVTADGEVAVAWGRQDPLPLVEGTERIELEGRPYLVGASSPSADAGTIRIAHDITDALEIRDRLLRSLILGAAVVALAGGALGIVSTTRLLAPLREVAERARRIDPADPSDLAIEYRGPQDEVSDLVRALNTSLANIRSQKHEERMFLTEIAHELASPLTLVSYHLDVARREDDAASLEAAAAAAKELLRTSQDLLVLARGEIERPLELRMISASTLVERVAKEYPGIRTDIRYEGPIVADIERMMQAVRNLVRNAVQAAGEPSAVTVSVRNDGGTCVLEVADVGPGMSPTMQARVFDRLFSGTQGVGVGLHIAKTIVEQHRGSIEVWSELGVGTRFSIRLPVPVVEPDPM